MYSKLFVSFLLVLLCSCDAKKAEREKLVSEVQNLQYDLDTTEKYLLSNKIDTVSDLKLAISSVVLRIKNNLELSTVDTLLAQKLNAYKVIGRNVDHLHRSYVNTKSAIQQEKTDLENLLHDLENGMNNLEEFSRFIAFEKGKIDTIKASTSVFVKDKRSNLAGFESLHQELNTFSLLLLKEENE